MPFRSFCSNHTDIETDRLSRLRILPEAVKLASNPYRSQSFRMTEDPVHMLEDRMIVRLVCGK